MTGIGALSLQDAALTTPQTKERWESSRFLRIRNKTDEEETSSLGINLMRGLGVPWVCQFQAGCEKGSGRTSSLTLSGKFSGVQSPSQELEPASCHPGWPQDPTRTAQMCPR